MKHLISILLLLSSNILFAQTNKQLDTMNAISTKKHAVNNNPDISVTPAINTTITKQPSSMPNSNTNPTTGTVISLKTNKNSKTKNPPGTIKADTLPMATKPDTTLSNNRTKAASKKKNKPNHN